MQQIKIGVPRVNIPLNPLTPMSDWYLISPYSITAKSNIKVMRIRENDH